MRITLTAIYFLLPCLAAAAPFSSWIDVRAECGAVGDGKADDTAAIQKGLDQIRPEDSKRKILYFPEGTYRITGTIQAAREKHRESQGIGLQGKGPDKSVLVYDGKGNEPMLKWGAWYSTIRSLGFQPKEAEGGAKPTAGIWFGPGFSTANEVSDCAFRDLPIGIQGGTDKTQGQAEVAVERCTFERCDFGILLGNWNSLDWWLWDCEFKQCKVGVSNNPGCGNYNVYRSGFDGSTEADCKIGNLGGFGFVGNESKGSGIFLKSDRFSAGANLTLQDNRISRDSFDKTRPDSANVYIGHPGPILILDNRFTRSGNLPGPDIVLGPGNHTEPSGFALLIGNETTGTNLLKTTGTFRALNLQVVQTNRDSDMENPILAKPNSQKTAQGKTPGSPVMGLGVVELATGAADAEIQEAVDNLKEGQLIYLPTGQYPLKRPVVIKTGRKVRIQGDGILNATVLVPVGDFGERGLIEVEPGGELELSDLNLQAPMQGGGAVGMIVKTADTEGVKVLGNQVQTKGFGPGLVVEGLDYGRVILRNHGHNGVTVFGGPRAKKGDPVPGRVELMCGASSRDGNLKPGTPIYDVRQGGKILVRDIWYEGDPPEFMQVRDRGDIVFVGGHVAPNKGKDVSAVNAIQLNGVAGSVLLAQAALNGADLTIGKLAEGFFVTLFGLTPYPGTQISYGDPDSGRSGMEDGRSGSQQKTGSPRFVQLMCRQNNTKITGSDPLPDVNGDGNIADRFKILRHWNLPDQALDAPIKLHRVYCSGSIGLVIVSAGLSKK